MELETGDTVLICSDGLWAYVAERNLAEALTSAEVSVAVAADALLDQALAAGAPDNISVALLRIGLVRPVVALPVLKTKTSSTRRTVLIVCALFLVVVIVWLLAHPTLTLVSNPIIGYRVGTPIIGGMKSTAERSRFRLFFSCKNIWQNL